jgi:hypothetical protein
MYAPRVIVIIDKAILRGHLEYLVMRKRELKVVTWKRFEGVDGEQRARPSPGAFLRVCRRRCRYSRRVSSSAGSPGEGRGYLGMTEEKRVGVKEVRCSGEERNSGESIPR